MASYTNISGVKLITTGDEAGTWGTSTNTNLEILDAASKGFKKITMTDADYTLPLDNNPSAVENGHYAGIEFSGANSAERTITLEQNDHTLVYTFLNNTGQNLVIKQGDGSGGTVTIADGYSAMVFCDGAGTGAKVTDVSAAAKAQALANSRNFSITGDITAAAVAFDGTGNVALSSSITAGAIVNADINASAAIADTKLATISTASKVSNSATTATDANTASAIVARDASGNFSAGTITASLSGNASTATTAGTVTTAAQPNITSVGTLTSLTVDDITINGSTISDSGTLTIDVGGDIVLDADSNAQVIFADGGVNKFLFDGLTGSIQTYTGDLSIRTQSSGAVTLQSVGSAKDVTLDSANDVILDPTTGITKLYRGGTQLAQLDTGSTYGDPLKISTSAVSGGAMTESMYVDQYGVNVLYGLRVGDTTGPTDNDIYAVGDIQAGGDMTCTTLNVTTVDLGDWTITESGGHLYFATSSGNRMKLDASGNLTVIGNVTAYGTIT